MESKRYLALSTGETDRSVKSADLASVAYARHGAVAENIKRGWTVKGVPASTIELVKEAARQRGMKIGAWVSEALHESAIAELDDATTQMKKGDLLLDKLDEIHKSIAQDRTEIIEHNKNLDQEIAIIRRELFRER